MKQHPALGDPVEALALELRRLREAAAVGGTAADMGGGKVYIGHARVSPIQVNITFTMSGKSGSSNQPSSAGGGAGLMGSGASERNGDDDDDDSGGGILEALKVLQSMPRVEKYLGGTCDCQWRARCGVRGASTNHKPLRRAADACCAARD